VKEHSLAEIDQIQIGRTAHELEARHGWNAHLYAASLAAEALAAGLNDEFEFWQAVEASLKPRSEP
jgi:hypothetical protein